MYLHGKLAVCGLIWRLFQTQLTLVRNAEICVHADTASFASSLQNTSVDLCTYRNVFGMYLDTDICACISSPSMYIHIYLFIYFVFLCICTYLCIWCVYIYIHMFMPGSCMSHPGRTAGMFCLPGRNPRQSRVFLLSAPTRKQTRE